MIDFLLGVPGKLKTLTDRLTATRAANLDNLNAAITTTAPASTALSTVTWTNALATLLGNTIQTSIVNTIQTGYTQGAGTFGASGTEDDKYIDVTITAVTLAKSLVYVVGSGYIASAGYTPALARLTSTTNLRIHTPVGGLDANGLKARWTVVEFK